MSRRTIAPPSRLSCMATFPKTPNPALFTSSATSAPGVWPRAPSITSNDAGSVRSRQKGRTGVPHVRWSASSRSRRRATTHISSTCPLAPASMCLTNSFPKPELAPCDDGNARHDRSFDILAVARRMLRMSSPSRGVSFENLVPQYGVRQPLRAVCARRVSIYRTRLKIPANSRIIITDRDGIRR